MPTQHVFELTSDQPSFQNGICVLFGDESFLRQLAFNQLRTELVGENDVPFAIFDGEQCEWRDVYDELFTVSLFGDGDRLVVVQNGDSFVSKNRAKLEDLASKTNITSALILQVGSWPSNTKLYKQINSSGLQIDCRAPLKGKSKAVDDAAVSRWLITRCKSYHQAKLDKTAAGVLHELVGNDFGRLEQEMAKLALFAGINGNITPEMVRDVVGGWRTKSAWDMVDSAANGNAAEAIKQLDRLLQSGENPIAMFAQVSWSLRRFATATALYEHARSQGQTVGLREVLEQAGVRNWPRDALQNAERQLKRLKRSRARELHRWLLQADLELKGTHSTPDRARLVLEKLLFKISA